MTGGFAEPHRTRNDTFIHLRPEEAANLLDYIAGQLRPEVCHRQQYSFNLQLRVQVLLDQTDRFQQLTQAL